MTIYPAAPQAKNAPAHNVPARRPTGVYIEGAASFSAPAAAPMGPSGGRPPAQHPDSEGTMVSRLWIQGDKRRFETKNPNGTRIVVANETGRWQLQPALKTAFRLDTTAPAHSGARFFSLLDLSSGFDPKTHLGSARRIATERVLGIECDVWRGNPTVSASPANPDARAPMRVWMPKNGQPAFPLKVEIVGMGPNGGAVTLRVTKLKFFDRMPDALFSVPKGYRVRKPAPTAVNKPPRSR